jgi:uncharacterized protein YjbI with pentapeptide repeats
MANDEHVAMLKQGVDALNAWRANAWRGGIADIFPDLSNATLSNANLGKANLSRANLSGADLSGASLDEANLSEAELREADLRGASLYRANLSGADLSGASLDEANLSGALLIGASLTGAHLWANFHMANLANANLSKANLSKASLSRANLGGANLSKAKLSRADLSGASFFWADLSGANLREANLSGTNLVEANLSRAKLGRADLSGANLSRADLSRTYLSEASLQEAILVGTDLTGADLTGCHIYGISAWNLKLEGAKQQNLVITHPNEPEITVDNIEVAQFIYLLLHNEKIRDVIDTIGKKAVLILGRFTDERKPVLDALREELRKRDYLPILFDFEKPRSRDTDETITLLARMARFIVADVSDAKAVLQELRAIVPDLPSVPVQPIIREMEEEPGMFDFYRNRPSFLPVHRYVSQEQLLADLGEKVIRPAELKVLDLRASP